MPEIANPVGNNFSAIVRVVKPPVMRQAGAKSVLEFRVANKTSFKEGPAFFFDVPLWSEKDQARLADLRKGEIVEVIGILTVREWEDKKTGATRQAFTLDFARVNRLERKAAAPDPDPNNGAEIGEGDDPLASV